MMFRVVLIQDALKDHGITDFRMLTPSRNIMSAVSANGQKNAYQVMAFRVASQNRFKGFPYARSNESNFLQYQESSIPNADRGCFNAGADPARKEALEEHYSQKAAAIKVKRRLDCLSFPHILLCRALLPIRVPLGPQSHETKTQSLNTAKQNALNELQAIKNRKDQLTFATNRIRTFESKIKHKSDVLVNAVDAIVNFNAEAQKSEYKVCESPRHRTGLGVNLVKSLSEYVEVYVSYSQTQVFKSMEKQIAKACHAFSILAQQSEKRIGETAALLSAKVNICIDEKSLSGIQSTRSVPMLQGRG